MTFSAKNKILAIHDPFYIRQLRLPCALVYISLSLSRMGKERAIPCIVDSLSMYCNVIFTAFLLFISSVQCLPHFQPSTSGLSILNSSSPLTSTTHNGQLPVLNADVLRPVKRWKYDVYEGDYHTNRVTHTKPITLEQDAHYVIAWSLGANIGVTYVELKNAQNEDLWGNHIGDWPSEGSTTFRMEYPSPITIGFHRFNEGNEGGRMKGVLELWKLGL